MTFDKSFRRRSWLSKFFNLGTQKTRWSLDDKVVPLHQANGTKKTWLDLEQCSLGAILLTGGTGAGKSSIESEILRRYCKQGYGMLILCCKGGRGGPAEQALEIAHETGRSDDVIHFTLESGHCFPFLDIEANALGDARDGIVSNVARTLFAAGEVLTYGKGHSGDSEFWQEAGRELVEEALGAVMLARGKVSLDEVYEFVQGLPQGYADLAPEQAENLASMRLLEEARRNAPPERQADVERLEFYLCRSIPNLAPNTRASVQFTASQMLRAFLSRELASLLGNKGKVVTPDMILDGAIVIADVPVKTYKLIARIFGVVLKRSTAEAAERRMQTFCGEPTELRPCVIFGDEIANWIVSDDASYVATGRQARLLSVWAIQSTEGLFAEIGGGQNGRARVNALLGNCQVRFICQSIEPELNSFHSRTLGREEKIRDSGVVRPTALNAFAVEGAWASRAKQGGLIDVPEMINTGWTIVHDDVLPPNAFIGSARGGTKYHAVVEAYCIVAGQLFPNGKRYFKARFFQRGVGNKLQRVFWRLEWHLRSVINLTPLRMEELHALSGLILTFGMAGTLLFGSWPGFPEWSLVYSVLLWLTAVAGVLSFPKFVERLLTTLWLIGDICLTIHRHSLGEREFLLIVSGALTTWLLGHRYKTLERRWKPLEMD